MARDNTRDSVEKVKDAELAALGSLPAQSHEPAIDPKFRLSAIFTILAAGLGLLSDGLQNNRALLAIPVSESD
jgi:hypothetical protein